VRDKTSVSAHTKLTIPVRLQHVYVCRLFVCSHGLFCKIKSRDCKGFKAQFEEIEEAFIDHSACVSEDMGNSHTLEM